MLVVEIKRDGRVIGVIMVQEKQFKTGSKGYFGSGKLELDGKKHQAQVQLVEIGSKNGAEQQPVSETHAEGQ